MSRVTPVPKQPVPEAPVPEAAAPGTPVDKRSVDERPAAGSPPPTAGSEPPAAAGSTLRGASRDAAAGRVVRIEPQTAGRLLDVGEVLAYRDLFRFLVWRQVRVRYAQSAIGIGWAVIQPVFSVLLFTIVFGSLAEVGSDGAPYALFSFAALAPWTYFSNAITEGVGSLVSEANLLRKVYFPRVLMPLSAVVAKLVDFVIALGCLVILMAALRWAPPWEVVFLPGLVLLMVAAAAGVSVWLTALAVQYRDVKHALTFLVQLAMYASPVVYPTSLIPERWRLLYALNPMVGVIEGFRSTILGTTPMPWGLIAVGAAASAALLVSGLAFFRAREASFADVA